MATRVLVMSASDNSDSMNDSRFYLSPFPSFLITEILSLMPVCIRPSAKDVNLWTRNENCDCIQNVDIANRSDLFSI